MEIADNKEEQLRYLEKLGLIKKAGSTYQIPLFSVYLLARNLSDFNRLAGKQGSVVSYGGNDNLALLFLTKSSKKESSRRLNQSTGSSMV